MKTRQDYEAAHEIVRSVISEWDPYALLGGGAPADEFDDEIAKVLTRVPDMHSPIDAAAAISAVFSSSFESEAFPVAACAEVGEKLFSRLAEAGILRHDV